MSKVISRIKLRKPFIGADVIKNRDFKEIEYVVDKLIPRGSLCTLAGESDTGKSSLLRQLAVSLAYGDDDFIGFKLNGTNLNFIHNTRTSSIAVDIYINQQNIYDKIQTNKEYFESLCGNLQIEWLELPEKKASRILTSRSCDLNNETLWEEYFRWLIETGEVLFEAIVKSYK